MARFFARAPKGALRPFFARGPEGALRPVLRSRALRRASTTAASTFSLLALTVCASEDALPISENLPPSVASPASEAYAPPITSAYTRDPATTAPITESDTSERYNNPDSNGDGREVRHAFKAKTNRATGATTVPLPAGQPANPLRVAELSDGQIVKIAETMQTAEIVEAQIVSERARNTRVKEFAERLEADNRSRKERGNELAKSAAIVPVDSSLAADLRVKQSQELTSVELARPEQFDQAFLEAQVEQNEQNLQLIDGRLIPDATDPKLKAELTQTRAMLQRQLDDARDIKRSLDTQAVPVP